MRYSEEQPPPALAGRRPQDVRVPFASPTEFKLKELGARRVTFENPANDFPQRIPYWREGESLMARIEDSVSGKPRSEEWRFAKQ